MRNTTLDLHGHKDRFVHSVKCLAGGVALLATFSGCRPSPEIVRQGQAETATAARSQEVNLRFAADDHERTVISYTAAARRNRIPSTFLIGPDGRIAWIGHPADLEEPLAELVHTGKVSSRLQEALEPQATLTVGDVAPPLHIDEWIRGEPVPQLQTGHVYALEFWATWCGPCVESLPHLSALQQQYADRMTVIAISKEPRATIAQFVNQLP